MTSAQRAGMIAFHQKTIRACETLTPRNDAERRRLAETKAAAERKIEELKGGRK